MTPQEKIKDIEQGHIPFANTFASPDDVDWLISRVKQLERALDRCTNPHLADGRFIDVAEEALSQHPTENE